MVMSMVADSSNQHVSMSRRRRWRRVLGVLVVVACIFTALQVREFFLLRSGRAPVTDSPAGDSTVGSPTTRAGWFDDDAAGGDPLSLRHTAGREGALERWSGDPAGLAPPAGASVMDGWQQRSHGATRQVRTYDCGLTLDDAAAHYRRQAADKGLLPLAEQSGGGTLRLQWTGEGLHVMVTLREEEPRRVRAAVTASRAE